MIAVSVLSAFILLALFRATTAVLAIVPLSGVYTFGLVAPLIGITATYSHADINRLTSNGIAKFTVVLVGLIHALSFFHWMEFFTRRGVNTQFYDKFSLTGTWWWSSTLSPNIVFGFGVIAFFAFLSITWRSFMASSPVESEYR
jgi:hypothetical protein